MKKLIVILSVIMVVMLITSCRSGYGCKGRSKQITGHKSNGY